MAGNPVTIRLLDPPIHEFLPSERQLEHEIQQLKQLLSTVHGVDDLMGTLYLLNTHQDQNKLPKPFGEGGRELVEDGHRQEGADADQGAGAV